MRFKTVMIDTQEKLDLSANNLGLYVHAIW